MARRTDHQPEFGSDSFLDIVANIVGILIILIVVAGVRVAQAPVLSSVVMPEVVIEEPEVIELLEPELGLPEELVSIPPVVEPEISDSAPEPEPTVVHRELP
ncbi:MAG: hypothetical protein KDA80_22215, partial [Planctomycetaceae bacterium]|nr:hypothetical protein [Planctomycetaceae bacterium]